MSLGFHVFASVVFRHSISNLPDGLAAPVKSTSEALFYMCVPIENTAQTFRQSLLIFTRCEKSKIWPRFSTPVVFE